MHTYLRVLEQSLVRFASPHYTWNAKYSYTNLFMRTHAYMHAYIHTHTNTHIDTLGSYFGLKGTQFHLALLLTQLCVGVCALKETNNHNGVTMGMLADTSVTIRTCGLRGRRVART